MNKNTRKLHAVMRQHQLSTADVSRLLGRSEQTVRGWRVRQTARPIPDNALELLVLKIASA